MFVKEVELEVCTRAEKEWRESSIKTESLLLLCRVVEAKIHF